MENVAETAYTSARLAFDSSGAVPCYGREAGGLCALSTSTAMPSEAMCSCQVLSFWVGLRDKGQTEHHPGPQGQALCVWLATLPRRKRLTRYQWCRK